MVGGKGKERKGKEIGIWRSGCSVVYMDGWMVRSVGLFDLDDSDTGSSQSFL